MNRMLAILGAVAVVVIIVIVWLIHYAGSETPVEPRGAASAQTAAEPASTPRTEPASAPPTESAGNMAIAPQMLAVSAEFKPHYERFLTRAEEAKRLPLSAYRSQLLAPYTDAVVTNAPLCTEPGVVFVQGYVMPVGKDANYANIALVYKAFMDDSNTVVESMYRSLDGRLWCFAPDLRSRELRGGRFAWMRVHIYGTLDEERKIIHVLSFWCKGKEYRWDEHALAMIATEVPGAKAGATPAATSSHPNLPAALPGTPTAPAARPRGAGTP